MRIARSLCIVASLILIASASGAQEASRILALCEKPRIDMSDAAWLALSSAGLVSADTSSEAALARLRELGWLSRASREDVNYFPATIGEFACIAMKAYRMRGGIGYALSPSPRYAFRELRYAGVLPSGCSQYQILSGVFAIKIIGKLDELRGGIE